MLEGIKDLVDGGASKPTLQIIDGVRFVRGEMPKVPFDQPDYEMTWVYTSTGSEAAAESIIVAKTIGDGEVIAYISPRYYGLGGQTTDVRSGNVT